MASFNTFSTVFLLLYCAFPIQVQISFNNSKKQNKSTKSTKNQHKTVIIQKKNFLFSVLFIRSYPSVGIDLITNPIQFKSKEIEKYVDYSSAFYSDNQNRMNLVHLYPSERQPFVICNLDLLQFKLVPAIVPIKSEI